MLSITGASFTFAQEGNTMGTTETYERLTVELEYQVFDPGKGEECFAVIKTEGWSVENGDEIKAIIDACVKCAGELSQTDVSPKP